METIKIYFHTLNILQYGSLSHYKDFFCCYLKTNSIPLINHFDINIK